MVSRISSQAAPTVTNGLGPSEFTFDSGTGTPRLFGRPIVQSSYCAAFTGTTGSVDYAVIGDFSRFVVAHRSGLEPANRAARGFRHEPFRERRGRCKRVPRDRVELT
jgi:hypothetical protein